MHLKNGVLYSTPGYRWKYFMFVKDDVVVNWTERFDEAEITTGPRVSKENIIDKTEAYKPKLFERRLMMESILK